MRVEEEGVCWARPHKVFGNYAFRIVGKRGNKLLSIFIYFKFYGKGTKIRAGMLPIYRFMRKEKSGFEFPMVSLKYLNSGIEKSEANQGFYLQR